MALYSYEHIELWPYGAMTLYSYGPIKLCKVVALMLNDHKCHKHLGHDAGHNYTDMQEHLDQMLLTATDMQSCRAFRSCRSFTAALMTHLSLTHGSNTSAAIVNPRSRAILRAECEGKTGVVPRLARDAAELEQRALVLLAV